MKTLLLIEDNFEILKRTTELLELEGYHVNTAANGREGFEKIGIVNPALIISEINELFPGIQKLRLY